MNVTIIGGRVPVSLRLMTNPALLSREQTRKCEKADLLGPCYVHDAVVNGRYGKAEFYYKPSYGQCFAVEITEREKR